MDASSGLFGETSDAGEELGVFFVDVVGKITTVVEDQVQSLAVGEALDGLVNTPVVLILGLTLPGEYRDASGSDGSGGMVLGGEDVLKGESDPRGRRAYNITYARRPGHFGTKSGESLDQDGGLDGHVQAPSNTSTLERLGCGVLLPHVHKTWHLMLGDVDFFAAEGSKGDICGDVTS